MSLGHGMAFISFLFFCYFSLILDIAIFSFRCLSLSLSLYIYTIKRAAKRQQLHTANEAEQKAIFYYLLLGQRTVVREDALYAQFI